MRNPLDQLSLFSKYGLLLKTVFTKPPCLLARRERGRGGEDGELACCQRVGAYPLWLPGGSECRATRASLPSSAASQRCGKPQGSLRCAHDTRSTDIYDDARARG